MCRILPHPIRVNNLCVLFWKRVIFLCLPTLLSGEATGAISFAQGPERGTNSAKQGTSSRNYSGNWRRIPALDPRWRPPWVQSMLILGLPLPHEIGVKADLQRQQHEYEGLIGNADKHCYRSAEHTSELPSLMRISSA